MIIATQPYWKQVMKFSLQLKLREACRSLSQIGIKQLYYCNYLGLAWEGKVLLQETWFPAASWLPESSWPSLSTAPMFWLILKVLTGNPSSIPKPWVALLNREFQESLWVTINYKIAQGIWTLMCSCYLIQHFWDFGFGFGYSEPHFIALMENHCWSSLLLTPSCDSFPLSTDMVIS